MYNSIVVRYLVRLWDFFYGFYEESFLKKVVVSIAGFLKYLFKGSVVKDIFTSPKSLIELSVFYKLYSCIIDIGNRILKSVNRIFIRLKYGSIFFNFFRSFYIIIKKVIATTNIKQILFNSIVFKFIWDLFLVEEEGDQWW